MSWLATVSVCEQWTGAGETAEEALWKLARCVLEHNGTWWETAEKELVAICQSPDYPLCQKVDICEAFMLSVCLFPDAHITLKYV